MPIVKSKNVETIQREAKQWSDQQKFSLSACLFSRYLLLSSNDSQVPTTYAKLLIKIGKGQLAKSCYRYLLKLQPKNYALFCQYAQLLLALYQSESSKKLLRKGIALFEGGEGESSVLMSYIQCLYKQKKFQQVQKLLSKYDEKPGLVKGFLQNLIKAHTLFQMGINEEGIQMMKGLITPNSKDKQKSRIIQDLVWMTFLVQDYDQTLSYCSSMEADSISLSDAYYYRSAVYFKRGKWAEGVVWMKKSLEFEGEDPFVLLHFSFILLQREQGREIGVGYLKRAYSFLQRQEKYKFGRRQTKMAIYDFLWEQVELIRTSVEKMIKKLGVGGEIEGIGEQADHLCQFIVERYRFRQQIRAKIQTTL